MSALLSTTYRKHITWNGYPADVMKSGLQKYIRRGIIDKALYCAGELDMFKEAPNTGEGEGIRTNFLHRLMVIFMEDVENLSIFDEVDRKMNELFKEREKANRSKEKEEHLISEVVIQMGKSTKARMCSHIRAVFNPKYKPIHAEFPSVQALWTQIEKNEQERKDDTFDFHCAMFKKYVKEKNILAVFYGFQIEASEQKLKEKLFGSSKPVWFIFQQLISPLYPSKSERVNRFVQWYKNHIGTMNEGFMCWLLPLLHELNAIPMGQAPLVDNTPYPMNWDQNRAGQRMEIDKYVEDKHTSKGRQRKAGLIEFAFEGALVENPAAFVNPLWKQFYEDGKRLESGVNPEGEKVLGPMPPSPSIRRGPKIGKMPPKQEEKVDDSIPLESTSYEFVVRTQLTTMGTKMDVYFAKDKAGKLVVVKGPYSSRKEIDILLSNTEWKKKYNLPYNRFEVKQMMPNRWPEGVPLGARNKVDRERSAYFLVFESYIAESQLKSMQRSSTLWPPTEVVDWEKIPFHFDYRGRALTEQEYIDYVHALLFRYLLGISDYADRNFVMKEGRVISIDEDVENHEIDLYRVLQKNKAAFVYRWLKDNYEKLDVGRWQPKSPNQQGRLEEIQDRDRCLRLFDPEHVPEPVRSNKFEPSEPVKQVNKPQITSSTSMSDSFVLIDNLYRSRLTLLDILDARGYQVEMYRKFSPAEATAAAAASSLMALNFIATNRNDPNKKCDVRYANVSRPKLETFFDDVEDADSENTEVVVMMYGPVMEAHHKIALSQYMKPKEQPNERGEKVRRNLRVSCFCIETIVINPLKHVMVPKHEIVPEDKHKPLMESMYITSKSKFPEIKFHADPIARCIGAVPGDIVKITRPSASSGEAIIYRVCAP